MTGESRSVDDDDLTSITADLADFLGEGRAISDALKACIGGDGDPDPDTVEKARLMIRTIRDGLDRGADVRRLITELRDQLVAFVYGADRNVGVRALAQDAGYGDSYVTRVAASRGIPRRTVRGSSGCDPQQ